ncbi:MAG: hypothetical protein AB6733_19855 [Clostridiaceae bacterium]
MKKSMKNFLLTSISLLIFGFISIISGHSIVAYGAESSSNGYPTYRTNDGQTVITENNYSENNRNQYLGTDDEKVIIKVEGKYNSIGATVSNKANISKDKYRFENSGNVRASYSFEESGCLVTLSNFDWTKSNEYYVGIGAGSYLFDLKIDKASVGKTISVVPDSSYVSANVSIPFADKNLYINGIAITKSDENGVPRTIGMVHDSDKAFVKPGNYNVQVIARDDNYGYNLFKKNCQFVKAENTIGFEKQGVALVTPKLHNDTNNKLELKSIFPISNGNDYNAFYGSESKPYVADNTVSTKPVSSFYVTKQEYSMINASFNTVGDSKDNKTWTYELQAKNVDLTKKSDAVIIDYGVDFKAKINMRKSSYNSEQLLTKDDIGIFDQYNNRLSYIWESTSSATDNNYERKSIQATLEFKPTKEGVTIKDSISLNIPGVKVPKALGEYDTTLKVEYNGPISITAATGKTIVRGADKAVTVSDVIREIAALPSKHKVTLKDKGAIEKARADYEKLTASQKKLVGNVKKLIEAENALKNLLQDKSNALNLIKYALAKLPASEADAKKITNKALLQKLINDVKVASFRAKVKGATDSEIKALSDYKRLSIAQARLNEITNKK